MKIYLRMVIETDKMSIKDWKEADAFIVEVVNSQNQKASTIGTVKTVNPAFDQLTVVNCEKE